MIYVLHGEDNYSSYNRLQQILKNYQNYTKVKIDEKSPVDEFLDSILTQDLLGTKKIIICENFIQAKKIKVTDLKSIPDDHDLIFWEKSQISSSLLSKFDQNFKIEQFKLKPQLFTFLNSLSPNYFNSLRELSVLRTYKQINLNWHLSARLQLLILAKLGISREGSEKIAGKPIQHWQWQKLLLQANSINLSTLIKLFTGIIKIDFFVKSGKTNIDETYLISTLLVKYLRG
ncbi:hypothetical protein A3A49_01170 [Candidatus Curtissbacteria bacterium RIFCSPLOWO2_01_FULL_38_11b]|uniref:DNA polymerase III delta N-terminal domain-containing protein n=1 Tax=Candidatus Curtissbacteria bacterium RIFCSPLOWO2_01_FULL_38_11b TaxID=1797725 RepID=A0A1F5GZK3_9BACT|nr:MAG: hypothetical protein A3A49_01170 [Candidatus Curtissbacteria bacterium RIFCSPLOWO2_01_FULL_38_11b]